MDPDHSPAAYNRANLQYETDLTDAEGVVIAPLMPEPASRGRPPLWTMREVLNAIFYVLRGGIAWRLIPKDLPSRSTTFGYFARWRDEGLFGQINHSLVMANRERAGRKASPTAVMLDSQSVKMTEICECETISRHSKRPCFALCAWLALYSTWPKVRMDAEVGGRAQ